jgi:hypothetical protein
MNHQHYQPETRTILKDSICAAQEALKIGIENSKEMAAEREARFGREHRTNRLTLERMEEEIKQMENALAGILNPNGKTES